MMGYEEKPFWLSKTVWGVVLTLIGGVLAQTGVGAPFSETDVPMIAGDVVGLIGAGLALYGRLKADKKVSLR